MFSISLHTIKNSFKDINPFFTPQPWSEQVRYKGLSYTNPGRARPHLF